LLEVLTAINSDISTNDSWTWNNSEHVIDQVETEDVVHYKSRSWLQDTSTRTLADILMYFAPPPLPVSPGSPEADPMIDQNRRSEKKRIGLIKTFSRVYPKKASTRRVNKKIANSTRNQRVFFSRYLAANDGTNVICTG